MSEALDKQKAVLERSAEAMLAAAKRAGADAAEVCGAFGQKTKITLEKQDYHMASSDEGYSLGIRVLRGRRQGFASCNSTDEKELGEIAARAVEIAGFSPENPNYALSAAPEIPADCPKELWDEKLFTLPLATQKNWTQALVDEATRDPRFRMNEGSVSVHSGASVLLNSHGTRRFERDVLASWSLMGMAIEGETITSFDYFGEIARKASEVSDRLNKTTKEFCDRVIANLNQGPAESYKGVVVFSPRAVIDILMSSISYHLNGRVVAEGTGKWTLANLGKAVLASKLTISDLPWLTERAGFTRFDREGVPTRNRKLVENGVLKDFLLDQYAAKALGRTSTGNAVGGPSGPPSVGSHCLVMGGGEEPLTKLIDRVAASRTGYLVVQRYSGQVDPVTGDFSGVAKGGEWWSGGERVRYVTETMISGNLFDALGNQLFGISRETEVIESAEEAPTVAIDGVSVTSA